MLKCILYCALFTVSLFVQTAFPVTAAVCGGWIPDFAATVNVPLLHLATSLLFFFEAGFAYIVWRYYSSSSTEPTRRALLLATGILLQLGLALPFWFTLAYTLTPDAASLQTALIDKGSFLQDVLCPSGSTAFPVAIWANASSQPALSCVAGCDSISDIDFCCVQYGLTYPPHHVPQTLVLSTPGSTVVIVLWLLLMVWDVLQLGIVMGQIPDNGPVDPRQFMPLHTHIDADAPAINDVPPTTPLLSATVAKTASA